MIYLNIYIYCISFTYICLNKFFICRLFIHLDVYENNVIYDLKCLKIQQFRENRNLILLLRNFFDST